jgi:hypothetical protein
MTTFIKATLAVSILAYSLDSASAFTPVPIPEGKIKGGTVSFTPVPIPDARGPVLRTNHPQFNAAGFRAPRGGR